MADLDYGRPLQFGLSVVPNATDWPRIRTAARVADAAGFDLLGIQDHPYQRRYLDTLVLIAQLLAETSRLRIFPDVASLPLRPPQMLAKEAATLDVLSGGRFELGLGAGAFWEAIEAMGAPRRRPGEAVEALEEAIEIIRQAWSGQPSVRFAGRHYRAAGYRPGPAPAHPIELWVGGYRSRMLSLIGRLADGWLPSFGRIDPAELAPGQRRIDAAAAEAGRDPRTIRRLLNIGGRIGPVDDAQAGLAGPAEAWVERLTRLATSAGVDTFIFWPAELEPPQIEAFAREVIPATRTEVARRRGRAA